MSRLAAVLAFPLAFALAPAAHAEETLAQVQAIARCQKAIAREGAKYAQRIIKSTLKCTEETNECQVQCELGVFGPFCDTDPGPGCCDPDDPGSNPTFGACMADAQLTCDREAAKRVNYETQKQSAIIAACSALTTDELCGAQTVGLNFVTLNAGCQALDPSYTCTLANLVNCVGGPLEQSLLDQISATLSPTASDAVAALNLEAQFPDIPVSRKVKGAVAAGKVDVWEFSGQAGDQIVARVTTRDDTPDATHVSNLHPLLTLLDATFHAVGSTPVRDGNCAVTNTCGSSCPVFKRSLPFDGTFHLAVAGFSGDSCVGGGYKLILLSPGGATPTLVRDDVDPSTIP